jgi:hypothetical protein
METLDQIQRDMGALSIVMEPQQKPAKKHAGGRPLKFKSVKALQTAIDAFFADTPWEEWTITGLALALDTSRETLMNYEDRSEYFDALKRGKLMIENAYERRLIKRGNAGDIFGLKNFGWTDKSEVVNTNTNFDIVDYIREVEKRNSNLREA